MYYIVSLILILADVFLAVGSFRRLIVSDTPVSASEYPFVVALVYCREEGLCATFCTGSLVAPNVVLTAGHCVYDQTSPYTAAHPPVPMSHMYVLVGSSSSEEIRRSQLFGVASVENAGFGLNLKYPLDNDIGLVFLNANVPSNLVSVFANIVSSPALASSCATTAVSIGFGAHTALPSEIAFNDGRMRAMHSLVHPHATCEAAFAAATNQTAAQVVVEGMHFCYGGNSVRTTCNGDSGGPVLDSNGVQIGLISFGASRFCGASPNFATNITSYVDWVTSRINGTKATIRPVRCDVNQWQCARSGECIPESHVCDNERHCADWSDEDPNFCQMVLYRNHRRLLEDDWLTTEFDQLANLTTHQVKFEGGDSETFVRHIGVLSGLDERIRLLNVNDAHDKEETDPLCSREISNLNDELRFEKSLGHNRADSDPSELVAACTSVRACTPFSFCSTWDKYLAHNATRELYAENFLANHNLACPNFDAKTVHVRDHVLFYCILAIALFNYV